MATVPASTSPLPAVANPPPHPHPAFQTQTIAAPLHFAGNDPKLEGELSAVDFLGHLHSRFLSNNVSLDYEKLALVRRALHGPAHA